MITESVLSMIQKANSAYVLALPYMTQYSDMKLLIFGLDNNHSLMINFPVSIKAFNRESLVLYEIETISVTTTYFNEQLTTT